jgi:hypothetical protein
MPPDFQSSLINTSIEDVDNYMMPALLTTLFCCMPFGMMALIYAGKVNEAKEEDDLEAALEASRKARRWYRRAVFTSLSLLAIYLVVMLVTLTVSILMRRS